jgi:LuxR family transcriptional regulator, maltose regulon positive regulatory protein
VRRLLLRTSVLDRVNGELAGLLTGDSGGERVLQDLEAANAFVVAQDPGRSWFRYHHLFADLLQLELRRTEPGQVAGLHQAASAWFAGHGYPVEAVRHAQAAQDWDLAARVLADRWPGLYLDGQAATVHQLLDGFPPGLAATDAELAVVAAADELEQGSLESAERYLGLAERDRASVPDTRRAQATLLFRVVRLMLAHHRGNLLGVAEEAGRLRAMADEGDAAQRGLGEDLYALALISLGSTEFWAAGEDAGHHLERGVTLARRIGRPYLELSGLVHQAWAEIYSSFTRAAERARQAVELAERHGWGEDSLAGIASMLLGAMLVWQGRLEEAAPWVRQAERTVRAEALPAPGLILRDLRGMFELARGRDAEALAAFQAGEQLARRLVAPHHTVPPTRAMVVHTLVRLGETERAEQILAELSQEDREYAEIHIAAAALRLAQGDPHAAVAELAPVLDRPLYWRVWSAMAYVLEATARDMLGDLAAAENALERALGFAEPDGAVTALLVHPAPGLLERHARHRTSHAALIAEILSLLAGQAPAPPAGPPPPLEPLSDSEIRVLRYLPTNLTGPEIADELSVSLNTVRTHMRHLYAKLGTHRRAEAVARARVLGLLAPSPHRGQAARPG